MDTAYLNRELGVGFSGGEKKKVEMLQLLLLQPKLAILDETDSGLDVDALSTVSHGMDAYRKSCDGSMLIITHNTRILEHLDVDRVHVMVKGHIVREDGASLIPGSTRTVLRPSSARPPSSAPRPSRRYRAAGIKGRRNDQEPHRGRGHRPQPLRLHHGEEGFERLDAGITPDIVREISAKKDEPQWMFDLRLKSLEIFNRFPDPTWGPSIEGLDMDNIVTYVKPNTDQKHDWESVPGDIKNTF